MTRQHTKPTLAFIVLAVLAAGVIGSSHHADADAETFIAGHSVSALDSAPQGAAQPADDERGDATNRASRTSRSGTARVELAPAPMVIQDSGDLVGTHTVFTTDTEQWLPKAHGVGHLKKHPHSQKTVHHGHED